MRNWPGGFAHWRVESGMPGFSCFEVKRDHGVPKYAAGSAFFISKIRRPSLTAQAEFPILGRISFPALGAEDNFPLMLFLKKTWFKLYVPNSEDVWPGLADFFEQPFAILFFFGFQFQKPVSNLLPGPHFLDIQEDTHPFTSKLVIQADCKQTHGKDSEPSIAESAGGQKLDGIGETGSRFTDGVIEDSLRDIFNRQVYHESSDEHAGGGIAVKGRYFFNILLIRVRQNTSCHGVILLLKYKIYETE